MTTSSTQARWPVMGWLSRWLRPIPYDRDLEHLAACGGEEMEGICAHVRGRPEDLRWLAGREPNSTELLCHMLSAAGVDKQSVPAKTMHQLKRTCSTCLVKFYCAGELGHRRAHDSFGEFCPNAPTLRHLQGIGRRPTRPPLARVG